MAKKTHIVALARSYAGISQTELADRIGRAQSFIARMERGDFDFVPYASQLRAATGLPLSFFSPDLKVSFPDSAVSFRKRKACPATLRDRAHFYAVVADSLLAPLVGRFVRFPEVELKNTPMEPPMDLKEARLAGGEVARMLRSDWGIGWGPIADVIRLVESKGVRVFFVREAAEHLDGFACWCDERPYLFLNQRIDDPARLRLDVCHELGHLIMHRELAMDSDTDAVEAMAHGFAVEFLAPWETFSKEAPAIPDLTKLGRLRSRWKISMQSMVVHMYTNGAISHTAYSNAFKRFSVLGYRRGPEPGWFVPDSSVIHTKFVEQVNAKGLSLATLAEESGISEKLLGDMIPASSVVDFDF